MPLKIVTSPNLGKKLVEDLRKKLEDGFDANVVLLFLTSSAKNDAKRVVNLLRERFPEAKMAGCTVEAYMTRDAIWSRGVAVLLIDSSRVEIAHTSGRETEKVFSRLNKSIRAEKKVVMFPLVYIPNRINVAKLVTLDRYYYRKFRKASSFEEKKEVLQEYSKILESKSIYPANVALRQFDGEVAGMCLMPLSGGFRTPSLFVNFKECHRCCISLGIRGKVKIHYHDVFPERGNSYEETVEILKEYFGRVERVKTVFGRIAIGEVNGKTAVDFLSEKIHTRDIKENDLERGGAPMVSPYGLTFISKETHGCSMLGLQKYPVNLYPSIFDLDNFYSNAVYTSEMFKGGVPSIYELINKIKKDDSFKFFALDFNIIPMFSKKIHLFRKYINSLNIREYLGIIVSLPSYKGKQIKYKYLSEIEKNIYFNGTGTSFMIEVPDLQ